MTHFAEGKLMSPHVMALLPFGIFTKKLLKSSVFLSIAAVRWRIVERTQV